MIRHADPGDAPDIADIWNRIIRDSAITFTTQEKTPDDILTLMAARGDGFLVTVQAGQIAGFASYGAFRAGPGYAATVEHTILLAPSARGQGVGRALMGALENVARGQGVRVMVGGISGENPAAVAFHTAIGFAETGRMPGVGHKFGRWLDLVLVQKTL